MQNLIRRTDEEGIPKIKESVKLVYKLERMLGPILNFLVTQGLTRHLVGN